MAARIFRFRLRWALEPNQSIADFSGPTCITLPDIGPCEIKPVADATGTDGPELVLTSPPYNTKDEAREASDLALSGLLLHTLKSGYAISLLPRRPPVVITDDGLQWHMEHVGGIDTLYRDRLGITVFEEIGVTRFASGPPLQIAASMNFGTFVSGWVPDPSSTLTRRALIAYELYASSRSESSTRARFLLLVMAVESLAKQEPRADDEQLVIAELVKVVAASGLPKDRCKTLMDGLRTFKSQSISEGCRRLITMAIAAGSVQDAEAATHFRDCYRIRGKIVHSGKTPSAHDLTSEANRLEPTVRGLLEWAMRNPDQESEGLWPSEFTEVLPPDGP